MKAVKAYAIAALSAGVALLLTLAIPPARDKAPFLLLTLAVMVSASQGRGPGLFATLLGAVLADYFLVPPLYSLLSQPGDCVVWILFCSVGFAITWITHRSHLSNERLLAANQTLAEAQRRTNTILESISDGFNVFDHEWRYTYVNAAGANMVGKNPEELLGKKVWELWPRAADSPFGAAYRRAMEENVPVQVEAFYPEPLNRWYNVRCYPSPDGLSLFFTDVTERKRAEIEISRLAAIVQFSTDAIISADLNGVFRTWNEAAEKLFGYSSSEAVGQSIEILVPSARRAEMRGIGDLVRRGE